jgi:CheY-like chemotaxis protein
MLLVDEKSTLRESLEQILGGEGYQIHVATNRLEAADQVRNHPIDLVVMNMLMPHAEAIGALIAIRSISPGLKIIAMSGENGDAAGHFLPLAKSLGASAILNHPFDAAKLIETTRHLLGAELQQLAS